MVSVTLFVVCTLAYIHQVPMFDCRTGFKLSQYHLNPKCHVHPEEGDVILVICTAGHYKNLLYNVMLMNIQVILKIADSPTVTDHEKPVHPLPSYLHTLHAFGVSGDEPLSSVDEVEMEYDPAEVVY